MSTKKHFLVKKGKGEKPMKHLILLLFLASLIPGCAGKGELTKKDLIEMGKDLKPQQELTYQKIVIKETLIIKNTEKPRPPAVVKRKRRKKKEAPKKEVRIYQISQQEGEEL